MARKPKAAKAETSALLAALKFVNVAQLSEGTIFQTHLKITGEWVIAFNGVLSACSRVPITLTACPHSALFIDALARCGNEFTLSQLDASKLAIQTPKFKAFVPCVHIDILANIPPDPPIAVINDELAKGFAAVYMQPYDGDKRIISDTLLLRSGSVIGTDGVVLLEYWHGIDLPQLVVPKSFAKAVWNALGPRTLVKLGFSSYSVTVYFDDGSWLRSQLYNEEWPNLDRVLNVQTNAMPVPKDLFEGLRHVAPFTESAVLFGHNKLQSHNTDFAGASYVVDGLPQGPSFNAKRLLELEPHMQRVDFTTDQKIARFFGERIRGAICGMDF